jgi:DNA invertase Pin-like site-specific DNA recombinase
MSNNTVITVIPATVSRSQQNSVKSQTKKRVAAYARVSTDSEEQLSSYEARVDFYTNKIKSEPDWIFIEVYADEGISATTTKRRDGFNRMITDALNGKIDLIITKSVSRFARNTVDTLTTVRQLKEKGVEVYFEKENIYTLDSKGELLITIMSSLAQEESRSISENVTWGQRKRMSDGKVTMPYKRFLGYARGADGTPQIVEDEAKTVRKIYGMFLDGGTYREIAAYLTEQGVPTPGGKQVWRVSTVNSILKNEKYAGNAILQKKFTVDFLTKKVKHNEGEVPQYFVENSHPAIISPETFELVRGEIERRETIGKQFSGSGLFTCRIVCGNCGGFYGRKVWDSTNKNRRKVWQCNYKYTDGNGCETPHLTEEDIKSAFVTALNMLIADRDRYIAEYKAKAVELDNTVLFDEKTARLHIECQEASAKAQELVIKNARTAQDQQQYKKEYDALTEQYNAAMAQIKVRDKEKQERIIQKEKLSRFIQFLEKTLNPVTAFEDELWQAAAEKIVVNVPGDITVVFRSGTEVHVGINA